MSQTIKALAIDANAQELREIDLLTDEDGNILGAIYEAINCSEFAHAFTFPSGDILYSDNEGLHDLSNLAFCIYGYTIPIFGKALVVGLTPEGEECDYTLSIDQLRKVIHFYDRENTDRLRRMRFDDKPIEPLPNSN